MYERNYKARVLKEGEKIKKPKNNFATSFVISWWRVFWIFVIGSVLVASFVIIRLPYFQINNVSVEGNVVVDERDILDFVNNKLQGNYLKFFPKTSLFLFSSNKVETSLKKQFSRLEKVSIKKTDNHSINISVLEYKGVYLWCQDDQNCFFMDEDGEVFSPAPIFSGNVYPKIFGGTKLDFPFSPISKDDMNIISKMISNLNTFNIKPNSFNFIDQHTLEVIFTHNGKDSKIILDPSLNFDNSYSNFLLAMRTGAFRNIFDSTDKYLEYIDLRFNQKIVYKFD